MQRKQTLIDLNQQQFTTVYQLAKDRNLNVLKTMAKDGQNLDVSLEKFTVTAQLAYEGDHEAVKFMLTNFPLDRNYIAWAYSEAGYYDYLSALGPINPTKVAQAAAHRGDETWVAKMAKHNIEFSQVIMGYATGRQSDKIKDLIRFQAINVFIPDVGFLIEAAKFDFRPYILTSAYGYAFAGHDDLLADLLREATELDQIDPIFNFKRYNECLHRAGMGYAQVSRRDKAEAMIQQGASLDDVACGAAQNGDTEYVEELIHRGANIDSAIRGYYTRWSFFNAESTIQLLAFTVSDKTRAAIAAAAPTHNHQLNSAALLAKANKIRGLMLDHNLTYNSAKTFLSEQQRLGLFAQKNPVIVTESQETTLRFKAR